jgi:cytoskeletal protein RodZ
MRKWIILMTIAAVLSLGVFVFANGSSTTPPNQPSISQSTTSLSTSSQASQESLSETAEPVESNAESVSDSATDMDNVQSEVVQNGDFQGNY